MSRRHDTEMRNEYFRPVRSLEGETARLRRIFIEQTTSHTGLRRGEMVCDNIVASAASLLSVGY